MSLEYDISTNENGAEFSYAGGGGCVVFLAGVVGLALLGYEYYKFDGLWPGWENLEGIDYTLIPMGFMFTIAGLAFYYAGLPEPHQVIFDNARHAVRIEKKQRCAVIPYQEVAGFSRRAERTSSSSNSNVQTYYNYVVYWYKNDGSVWDIQTKSTAEQADELIDQLNQVVDLQAEGLETIKLEAPRAMQYEETGSGAVFKWKNKITFERLVVFIFAGCIGIVCYGMLQMAQESFDGWHIIVFFGFFFTMLFGITAVHLIRTIKDVLGIHQLTVDPDSVEYALVRGDNKLMTRAMPLNDVKSVMFDAQGGIDDATLHILNTAQFEAVQQEIQGDISIKDAPRLIKVHLTNTITLRIDGMDIIDQVHLEQLVEAAIRRAGGA